MSTLSPTTPTLVLSESDLAKGVKEVLSTSTGGRAVQRQDHPDDVVANIMRNEPYRVSLWQCVDAIRRKVSAGREEVLRALVCEALSSPA